MYHPTTRVLTVLELLQAHGRMSGSDIAARLEVDLRTVRRYVTMLQDLGLPVESERGRYGGYRLRPGFRLPPLMLSDEEALAVSLGLRAAQRIGLAAAAPAVEGALAKVERVLPTEVRDRVAAVQAVLELDPVPRPAPASTSIVIAMATAARDERRVHVRYLSAQGELSERRLEPYGLVHFGGRWYVAANCLLRGGLRLFRVDRIQAIDPLDESFTRPAGFDSLAFVQAALAEAPNAWTVEAILHTPLEDARLRVLPHEAVLEPIEGGVLLRLHAECLDWAARYLAGLGCDFLVERPTELRAVLRQLARRVHAAAGVEDDGWGDEPASASPVQAGRTG